MACAGYMFRMQPRREGESEDETVMCSRWNTLLGSDDVRWEADKMMNYSSAIIPKAVALAAVGVDGMAWVRQRGFRVEKFSSNGTPKYRVIRMLRAFDDTTVFPLVYGL